MLHGSIFEREMQKDPEDINCLDYKEYPLVDESELIQMEYFLYRCGGKYIFPAMFLITPVVKTMSRFMYGRIYQGMESISGL